MIGILDRYEDHRARSRRAYCWVFGYFRGSAFCLGFWHLALAILVMVSPLWKDGPILGEVDYPLKLRV